MKMSKFGTLLLALSAIKAVSAEAKLRILEAKVADVAGAGMDGGALDIMAFGGGEFSLEVCNGNECCNTGELNTRDENWERGEINQFVGRQLGACEDVALSRTTSVTLIHQGPDGGLLDYISLSDAFGKGFTLKCPVNQKLDDDSRLELECQVEATSNSDHRRQCNGNPDFCDLTFDKVVFPGTHNAGTGQGSVLMNCFFKNQDLSLTEQLDLGIRFFDLDVIYNTKLVGCNGLETGHGALPSIGLYQCFADLGPSLRRVRDWLQDNPNEVITLYFGELHNEEEALPRVKDLLRDTFKPPFTSLNDQINISDGQWPSLRSAIDDNQRVFAFIRSAQVLPTDTDLIREIKIKAEGPTESVADDPGAIKILSTFKSRPVGSSCDFAVIDAKEGCQLAGGQADLIKISVFGSPGRGGRLGTECLWDIARKCNRRIVEATEACLDAGHRVNFVQADYPNYPANGLTTLVKYCHHLTLKLNKR